MGRFGAVGSDALWLCGNNGEIEMPGRTTDQSTAHLRAGTMRIRPVGTRAPLVSVAAAVLAGIWAGRTTGLSWAVCYGLAVAALLAWGRCWCRGHKRRAAVLLLIAAGGSGSAWHQLRCRHFDVDDLGHFARYAGAPVCLEAVARAAPERLAAPSRNPLRAVPSWERSRVPLRVVRVRDARTWRRATGHVLLDVDGHVLGVRAGDRVRVFGKLVRPRPAMNPGGFDAAAYEQRQRRLCRLFSAYPDAVRVVRAGTRWSLRRWLDHVRIAGERTLRRMLDPVEQRLAAALLLGRRRDVERARIEAFARSGTLHLLAISGLHVGLFAAVWLWLLRLGWLPERVALVATACCSVLYAAVVGGQPSVVRAAVMIVAYCLARLLGRVAWSVNTLGGAAVVLVAMHPATLFSTGAQLSFVAVAVLIAISKRWDDDLLARWMADDAEEPDTTWKRWLRQATFRALGGSLRLLAASVAVWCVTAPLVIERFHLLSPLAPLLTLVLLAPVSVVLLSGFATLTLGWLIPVLGAGAAWMMRIALMAIGGLVETVAAWPWSHVWLSGVPGWWLIGFYGGLGAVWMFWRERVSYRWLVACAFAWVGLGLLAASVDYERNGTHDLRCTFLSVGHGLAAVVELPDGRTLLYDAGRLGAPDRCASDIAAFLWHRGIRHLDAVVLSHADVDHYNALPGLLERFSIGAVYTSPMMYESRSEAVEQLRLALEQAGVRQRVLLAPQRLKAGRDVAIEALHPTRQGVLGSDNANSLVLLIVYESRRILLTGDLEANGLRALLAEEPIRCDVLLAPHHGSRRSDFRALARWARPRIVVVSGDRWHEAAALMRGYANLGARVFHTDRDGAVELTIGRHAVDVAPYRSQARCF